MDEYGKVKWQDLRIKNNKCIGRCKDACTKNTCEKFNLKSVQGR